MQKLDKMFHSIMVKEEKMLPAISSYWWSEPLHKAYLTVLYWRKAESFSQNDLEGTIELEEIHEEIGLDVDLTYVMTD
eukprot:4583379-Ditylum_brightwellii.AAC.1